MRFVLALVLCFACVPAFADRYVTRVRTSAQEDAEFIARTGRFAHRGTAGCREGIGYGSTPEQALRNCCYWGRYAVREKAVARGANGRYYAVVRYHD